MALVLKDRVKEQSTTTGTGSFTLSGAYDGYQTFAAAIASGSTVYYCINNTSSATEWEVGVGTFTSPSTLSRTTVLESSNAGSLVAFGAGTKEVFVTYPAEKSVILDGSGNVTPLGTVSSGTWQGTTVGLSYGGTGQTSAQAAINSLAGAITSGQYLRGNGTNVVMSAIQAADVPTLNQNTTGTASNVTGTVAIANGGTGATTRQNALDALAGATTSGYYLRGNGADVVMSAIQAADVPTLNQNTTGSAGSVANALTVGSGLALSSGTTYNGSAALTITNAAPGVIWQSVQTTSFTAAAGNGYPIDTAGGAITVTLPASPTAGNSITLTDYNGKWATNNVTVNPNGNKLNGSTINGVLSTNRQSIQLVYVNATQGWIAFAGFNDIAPSQTYSGTFLLVAGGGGGGSASSGGGGGGGGYITGSKVFTAGTVYTAVIGAGGPAGNGNRGGNSTLTGETTAVGGGWGANHAAYGAGSGGSGGGGSYGATTPGSGTSGQGNSGGAGNFGNGGNTYYGGSGGGAGAAGATNSNGGAGLASSITGTSVYRAGGGGCLSYVNNNQVWTSAGAGGGSTANLGGGGTFNASGGSGVCILSVPTANYSGVVTGAPTVTTNGSNTVITFTASGTYTA